MIARGPHPGRLRLLASALAGRALQVAAAEQGSPAWTDGGTVFVDADTPMRDQIEALSVQASLLAAGSLESDVVRRIHRRPAWVRRYLAIEGHRALSANEPLLPPQVRSLVDDHVAARVDSPDASLAVARSGKAIADPPRVFGTIRTRHLLASRRGDVAAKARERDALRPRPADLDESEGDELGLDVFTSPGRGGALGRWLERMLESVRRLGGGSPGVESPTHRARAGAGGGQAALSTRAPGALEEGAIVSVGARYPEWDAHRRRYRPDWCTVREALPRPADVGSPPASDRHGLRRSLARLGTGLDTCHRQEQGDDIDLDAAIEARVQRIAGTTAGEAIYLDSMRRRRDLAVLVLLDVSGSVGEPGAIGDTVHDHQRAVAASLMVALHELGDRVALYAFQSRGRSAVQLVTVKRFDDGLDTAVMRRLGALAPGAYSRLGAAIRHGAFVLETRGGTSRRLLVVLSDGLAYDDGYELAYGAADARRALAETRRRGTACLGLSVGASTDADALRRVFGSAAHAAVPRPERLRQVIGPLFRAALRSAEVRRR